MIIESIKCDGCGTQKGDGNHWFRIRTKNGLTIVPWKYNAVPEEKHACSDSCVVKFLQQWLDSQQAKDAEAL